MVVSCAAYGCSQRFHKEADIRFHSFPLTNPDLLKNWLIAMRRENFSPKKHSRLCGKHFLSTDYHLASRKLLTDSVPSVFNFPQHLQKTEKRRRVLKRIVVDDDACSSSQASISSTSLKRIVVDDDACSSSQAIISSTSLKRIVVDDDACSSSQAIISSTSLKRIVVDDDACSSSQAIISSTSLKRIVVDDDALLLFSSYY